MLNSITIRQEGDKVLLLSGGVLIGELPWQSADELANALRAKARQAEEHAKAQSIIYDSAILMRSGAPFSFSVRPDILKEAAKQAAWNSNLRRYMPGGVKSSEVFGAPTIIGGRPISQILSARGVPSGEQFGKV
jgi:hypothetical protein